MFDIKKAFDSSVSTCMWPVTIWVWQRRRTGPCHGHLIFHFNIRKVPILFVGLKLVIELHIKNRWNFNMKIPFMLISAGLLGTYAGRQSTNRRTDGRRAHGGLVYAEHAIPWWSSIASTSRLADSPINADLKMEVRESMFKRFVFNAMSDSPVPPTKVTIISYWLYVTYSISKETARRNLPFMVIQIWTYPSDSEHNPK